MSSRGWRNTEQNGRRGRDYHYTDQAILTMALLQEFLHLA